MPTDAEIQWGTLADGKAGERLLMFSGRECVHCKEMYPLVHQLEQETGLNVLKLEVWHDAQHDALREKLDDGFCGGVPFFFNEKTGKKLCGSVSYERLKAWALGK